MCLIFNFFYKISYDEQDVNQSTVSANEHNDVIEVATKYFQALRSGNVDVLADILNKNFWRTELLIVSLCNLMVYLIKNYGGLKLFLILTFLILH